MGGGAIELDDWGRNALEILSPNQVEGREPTAPLIATIRQLPSSQPCHTMHPTCCCFCRHLSLYQSISIYV